MLRVFDLCIFNGRIKMIIFLVNEVLLEGGVLNKNRDLIDKNKVIMQVSAT